jgi:ATP-dependent DNA helicase RecG
VLADQIRRIEEVISVRINQSLALGTYRHSRHSTYPLQAIQQVLRNAIMHRDYEISSPVRATWYSDRIEVINPGGPYGMSPDQLGRPNVTAYRNPNVAEAMHNLGYAERFGIGIPLARRLLEEAGHPPLDLSTEGNFTLAVIRSRP